MTVYDLLYSSTFILKKSFVPIYPRNFIFLVLLFYSCTRNTHLPAGTQLFLYPVFTRVHTSLMSTPVLTKPGFSSALFLLLCSHRFPVYV